MIDNKYKRPTADVVCANPECGISFEKIKSEIKRTEKRNGGKHFCSLSCHGKVNHKQLKKFDGVNNKDIEHKPRGKKEHSGFKEHIRRANQRKRKTEITVNDLLEQWNKQNGICPYTGVKLEYPYLHARTSLIYMASLDRIDSSIGYIKENIQYISAAANFAKNTMTHEEMVELCKIISDYWSTKA